LTETTRGVRETEGGEALEMRWRNATDPMSHKKEKEDSKRALVERGEGGDK